MTKKTDQQQTIFTADYVKKTGLLNKGKSRTPKYKNKKSVNTEGVKFDSALEEYCYNFLKHNNIPFEFQKTISLQESFKHSEERQRFFTILGLSQKHINPKEKTVRAISMIIDFMIEVDTPPEGMPKRIYIDTKGMVTKDWLLKAKMLQFQDKQSVILKPCNRTEVKELQKIFNLYFYE